MRSTSVAVVGAGPSGLVAAKSCLECGLEPVIFEASPLLGGVWRKEGGIAWKGMHTNLTHFTCSFSDFPWPEGSELYPSREAMADYLESYAEHFELKPRIHFNTPVEDVCPDGEGWQVTYRDSGEIKRLHVDRVVMATGIFAKAYLPTFEGMASFRGRICHSRDVDALERRPGERLLVVGGSFSAFELAHRASEFGPVDHLMRRPSWILPRYLPLGESDKPLDLAFYSRAARHRAASATPEANNLRKHGFFSKLSTQASVAPGLAIDSDSTDPVYVAISDGYLKAVSEGRVRVHRGDIATLTEAGVVLRSGQEIPCDCILACTGFRMELPMDPALQRALEMDADDALQPLLLHGSTFHPCLPGMAFVGMYRGPYFGVMELQARWMAEVFAGGLPMPTEADMWAGLDKERAIREARPRPQFPHGDYVGMADAIAATLGLLPDFEALKSEDPELYDALWNQPMIPAHYRLFGPHAKPELALAQIRRLKTDSAERSTYAKTF